eukprot:CAMPEP_0115856268 /NCGR_PEP_ID=MMETSP0287-20121206/14963_1 /TAXON_ID=412157 /ORGANISM="Chrysochromulina rotalis, Strain UIO044" /LENGTH=78 /DNA_ID=CAMNT_0003310433 /DNA_START=787 /DNA_END=1023 /DNA_ORIENTATION=-
MIVADTPADFDHTAGRPYSARRFGQHLSTEVALACPRDGVKVPLAWSGDDPPSCHAARIIDGRIAGEPPWIVPVRVIL